jgi:hypothetical protein
MLSVESRNRVFHARSYMNGDLTTTVTRDAPLETLAAELALAAYRVALGARMQGTWLDLELDLWRALADTVKMWGEENSSVMIAGDAAFTAELIQTTGQSPRPTNY